MVTMEEKIKNYAEKLGRTEDDVKKERLDIQAEEKKENPKLSEEDSIKRATKRIFLRYRGELITKAPWLEGVVIGVSGVIDVVAKVRRAALEMYKKNPERAIELRYIKLNEKGEPIPLDKKETFATGAPNPNYNKELPEHNYIRSIFGAVTCKEAEITEPKKFKMVEGMRDDIYKLVPKRFKPIKFRANISKTKSTEDLLQLNPTRVTKFIDSSAELPPMEEILESELMKPYMIQLKDIFDYHKANLNIKDRIMITQADVLQIRKDILQSGNKMMIVWDEGLPEEDTKGNPLIGITCFIPADVFDDMDFGEESRIYIVGRTDTASRPDETGAKVTTGVNINVMGMYAIPAFKRALDESEILPEAVEEEEPTQAPSSKEGDVKPKEAKKKPIW